MSSSADVAAHDPPTITTHSSSIQHHTKKKFYAVITGTGQLMSNSEDWHKTVEMATELTIREFDAACSVPPARFHT